MPCRYGSGAPPGAGADASHPRDGSGSARVEVEVFEALVEVEVLEALEASVEALEATQAAGLRPPFALKTSATLALSELNLV